MLDDLKKIKEIDKSNMFVDLEKFPEQITESEEIVNSANLASIFKVDSIIICGMGGSAISGDILQELFRDRIDIPIYVNRQYDLPKWANKNTLVLTQSYSGNTEETLSAFKHACQKHCKIIAISSGGKLQEYCEKREIPFIKIPSGIQPRAATGYLLFSAIYSLRKTGAITHDISTEIQETIQVLKEFRKNNKLDVKESENLAKQLSRKILNTIPQVYGFTFYSPIAKRWCTQFNENSKIICRFDEVSESNHNDIVAWSMDPEVTKKFTCILLRDHDAESIYMNTRLNFMTNLFKDVAGNVIEVTVNGKKTAC